MLINKKDMILGDLKEQWQQRGRRDEEKGINGEDRRERMLETIKYSKYSTEIYIKLDVSR